MFRALSTRRSRRVYEQLGGGDDASAAALAEPTLIRAKSLPARILGSCKSLRTVPAVANDYPSEQIKKASKVHPFFSLFESKQKEKEEKKKKKKKKATTRPEFSRYMEYLREGGVWDVKANMPVMYYK